MGREAGWAGEAERRPLVSISAQVVRGAGQVFALGWWGWKLLSSPFGDQELQMWAGRLCALIAHLQGP